LATFSPIGEESRQSPHIQRGGSIRQQRNDPGMLLVTVVCSDPECIEEREVEVDDLDAIDATVCGCGHGFVVVCVSELDEPARSGSLLSLPQREPAASRRAA
jgi:hypothetical protein